MSTKPTFAFISRGASIQEINVGGVNIVHGFPNAEDYETVKHPHFGETIGRVANRISGARLDSVNGGRSYALFANEGANTLHGGQVGWGKRSWDGPKPVAVRSIPGIDGLQGGESVQFSLTSPDGEEGFPGELSVTCTYTAGTQNVAGKEVQVLAMEYEAELVGGAEETPINMTNHSYFNLTGGPTIEGTNFTVCSNKVLPVGEGKIPTGAIGTYSDFEANKLFTLGPEKPNPDDCFVVNDKPETVPIDTRTLPLTRLIAADHSASGIHLEVLSTEPAFQVYTGNGCDVPAVPGATAKGNRSAFCVEPSRYVNAVNVPEWKSMIMLKKGEKYGARNVYRAWKE